MDYSKIKVSEHARRRFVERRYKIADRDEVTNTINREEHYIDREITRLIGIADEFYFGQTKNNDKLSVVNAENWLFLIDPKTNKVVTLYSVDLGLGDEYNLEYLSKIKEKLNASKEKHEEMLQIQHQKEKCDADRIKLTTDITNISNEIERAKEIYENLIAKKQDTIKALEELNAKAAKLNTSIDEFDDDSPEIINTLLQRQVF